jgi:hypothetical protein
MTFSFDKKRSDGQRHVHFAPRLDAEFYRKAAIRVGTASTTAASKGAWRRQINKCFISVAKNLFFCAQVIYNKGFMR